MSAPNTIPLQPVKSGNISAIGHDPVTQTLAVQFSSGKTYHYPGVSQDTANQLVGAESIGAHFAKHIRTRFPGIQLGGDKDGS